LSDPKYLWAVAQTVLKPTGRVVLFMPNGSPLRRSDPGYHQLWGEVHPLLLTPEALDFMAMRAGFTFTDYQSSPYRNEARLDGAELMFTALRNAS